MSDTETAIDAMQLVLAYTAEFQGNIGDTLTDPAYAAKVLNTLSLISRQIDIAEHADATATLAVENDSGEHVAYTITSLKAGAIYYEAMCRMAADPKRSIKLLEQVLQLTPDAAHAHFWTGMLNADMLNKGAAVAAFEQALALDPRNMEYRKELLRAQSISGSQVAYDRAARGVRTTVSVARWAWYAFWIIMIISIVAAIAKGDFTPVIVLGVLFAAFNMLKQCLGILKSAFTGED
jgi:tetratricopeptide (TPR) repeat protein